MEPHRYRGQQFKGFTIVELLVVIVVIGILAKVTIISYTGITSQAKDSNTISNIKSLDKAINVAQLEGYGLGISKTIYVSIPDTSLANLQQLS